MGARSVGPRRVAMQAEIANSDARSGDSMHSAELDGSTRNSQLAFHARHRHPPPPCRSASILPPGCSAAPARPTSSRPCSPRCAARCSGTSIPRSTPILDEVVAHAARRLADAGRRRARAAVDRDVARWRPGSRTCSSRATPRSSPRPASSAAGWPTSPSATARTSCASTAPWGETVPNAAICSTRSTGIPRRGSSPSCTPRRRPARCTRCASSAPRCSATTCC